MTTDKKQVPGWRGAPSKWEQRKADVTRNWSGYDLRRLVLKRVNFADCDLSLVDLQGCDLRGAYLRNVNLESANLAAADLRGAYLLLASLRDADLTGADFSGANLERANLQGALQDQTNFADARLTYTVGLVKPAGYSDEKGSGVT